MEQSSIRVMHVVSGDLWAGAEAQVAALADALGRRSDCRLAAVVLNEGELARRLRQAGATVAVFPETESSPLSICRRMVRFMRFWRPDVVHTHRTKENILGALAARAARVPHCIRTVHGAAEFVVPAWAVHKRLVQFADKYIAEHLQNTVVAVSTELAAQLSKALPHAHVEVIENGLDPEATLTRALPAVKLEPDKTHVAFVGRLVPVKRVDLFLRAAARLVETGNKTYRFHIIGEGPLRADLETLARSLGISSVCAFHGFQPDVPRWLAAMDCLVLTSDHEGLPMTALEARALGRPVVAHAVGGLPGLLGGSNDCSLVRAQDPEAFARAIRECANQHTLIVPRLPPEFHVATTAAAYVRLYSLGNRQLRRSTN